MKKQLIFALVMMVVCGVAAIGCGAAEEPAPAAPVQPTADAPTTTPSSGGNAAPSNSMSTPGAPPVGPNGSPP